MICWRAGKTLILHFLPNKLDFQQSFGSELDRGILVGFGYIKRSHPVFQISKIEIDI